MWNLIHSGWSQDRCGGLHSKYLVARLAAVALCILVRSSLFAQVPEGAIHGVVSDITGVVVTTARLHVSQLGFGGGRIVGADTYGWYYITNLEPGDYQLEDRSTNKSR
jgi:hypothetical protein